jgi:hypothetical protein
MEVKTMDISKLRFDIDVHYDCDEGIDSHEYLDDGTYEEAVNLFSRLNMTTYIKGYYHTMTITIAVYEENENYENQLDLSKILDGDYEWLDDQYYTDDKNEATDLPGECLKFLEDLKKNGIERKQSKIKEQKDKISDLRAQLEDAEKELVKLMYPI